MKPLSYVINLGKDALQATKVFADEVERQLIVEGRTHRQAAMLLMDVGRAKQALFDAVKILENQGVPEER